MNYYIAYELKICSDIEIPELLPWFDGSEDEADVHIIEGDLSLAEQSSQPQVGPFLFANEENVFLVVKGIARYWVQSGKRITYQKANNSSDDDVRAFLLGSCFGAILIQRDFLVLHGCTIKIGSGCIVCVGYSTAGKSTLAASFMQRGYKILSDDVTAIDSNYRAVPGIPRIKINQDVAAHLDINTAGLNVVRAGCDNKFSLPLGEIFCSEKVPVLAVYELNPSVNEQTTLTDNIGPFEKTRMLNENLYRPRYVQALKKSSSSLQRCCKLAERANVFRINRSIGCLNTEKTTSLILENLQRLNAIESS